jgi:glutathione S-transferase
MSIREKEAAQAAVKETGRKSFWTNCQEIDSMFQGNGWIMGNEYTLVDPYALVFYSWGMHSGFPMKELTAYAASQDRVMNRPTVRKSGESAQSVSIS